LWDEEQNEACITDLGISARLCDARGIAGSLPFVAPEVFEGDVWIGNDVYSLGATLFWLLTGKRPFSGTSASEIVAQIRQGLPDDDPRCYAIPDAVESLIRSALDADRNKRIDLKTFVATLRSEVNKLLVDTLATYPATSKQSSVDLKLTLSKEVSSGCYEPLATTPAPFYRSRDMKKVPRRPEQVRLKTGDFVRIEVETNMAGYLAVWNVGPTGNLNLLHPEDFPESPENWPHTQSATPLHVLDVQMAKPPGKERLFAMWTRRAPTIRLKDLSSVGHADGAMKRYCATRDMKRVKRFVDQLAPSDFRVVVIGVDHQ
jgi:serine/threonine protein kinase